MKIYKFILSTLCISLLLSFVSCTGEKHNNIVMDKEVFIDDAMPTVRKASKLATNMKVQNSFATEEAIIEAEAPYSNGNAIRKLIKTGNITIEIDSLNEAENMISDFAKSFGGYITDSSMYDYSFSATVKIPEAKFDSAMTAAGELGKVKYRSINNQDVTEDFYDLKTRLETKKIMRDKLESYLSQAKDIRDLLEIERQLNSVVSEIEVMQGRMNRLSNQIDYSTIYIYMNLPTGFDEHGFKWPDLGEKVREFGSNFVNFMTSILFGFFYIIIFGIPLLALIAFFFWLLFGRVGLLIKLFDFLRGKKKIEK